VLSYAAQMLLSRFSERYHTIVYHMPASRMVKTNLSHMLQAVVLKEHTSFMQEMEYLARQVSQCEAL